MTVNKILSWQQSAWKLLLSRADALAHAMLLIGPAGTGKGLFAELLAARLLCETAQGEQLACSKCAGCHLFATENHPDYRKITLEDDTDEDGEEAITTKSKTKSKKPAAQIKIDQIRALDNFVFVGSHRQGKRVVVIDPADAMNPAAANLQRCAAAAGK
jgi:DNA polymerase III subunit delta'